MSLYDRLSAPAAKAMRLIGQDGWSWRRRTSSPSAATTTWAADVALSVVPVSSARSVETDDQGTVTVREREVQIELDLTGVPQPGDMLIDPDEDEWLVVDTPAEGPGWMRYQIRSGERRTRGADRGRWSR